MEEFLKELEEKLKEKNIENWEEILDKYEKRFNFGLESGLSDEEIIGMLGSIEDIIDSYSKKEDTDMDGLKIHVSTVLDDVFFERSKDDAFHVYLENINENSYKIIKNEKEINIEYINKKFFGLNRRRPGVITIALPFGVVLGDITLSSVSGDLKSEIDLSGKNMDLEMVSGDSKFNKLHMNSFKAHVVSGDLDMDSINSNSIEFSSVSGDIEVDQVNSNSLKAEPVSGDISINEANDGIHISTSSISGDIRIQGKKYKNFTNEVKEEFKNERSK